MKSRVSFLPLIAASLICGYPAFPGFADSVPPAHNLSSTSSIQDKIQRHVTKGKQYNGCLFGDSISSSIGNTLGKHNFNFARGGVNSLSLSEKLKALKSSQIKCKKAIIAIGANDAKDGVSNARFIKKMSEAISLLRSMDTREIFLIPAFYSTIAASHKPNLAGTITRVDSINALIREVAAKENVSINSSAIQNLFENRTLKKQFTRDGVHLNAKGKHIYRQALLQLLS